MKLLGYTKPPLNQPQPYHLSLTLTLKCMVASQQKQNHVFLMSAPLKINDPMNVCVPVYSGLNPKPGLYPKLGLNRKPGLILKTGLNPKPGLYPKPGRNLKP